MVAWQADRFTRGSRTRSRLDAIRETGGMIATVAGPVDLGTAYGRSNFRGMADKAELASTSRASV